MKTIVPGGGTYFNNVPAHPSREKTMESSFPDVKTLVSSPLRHRITVCLAAPVAEVWPLVGDYRRLPEYSAGIEHVEVPPGGKARV